MGRVYLGEDRATERQVAIKLLQENLSEDPRFVSRMEREAAAVRRVTHPNSVRLLDFGRDPLGVYLVMEYLSGESLWARLGERGRLSPGETVSLLCQILAPLSLCHAVGIVHRDLKPDNIMLCREGDREVAKLLDFGIARLSEGPAVTRTGQILGTPAYMSPEQISGKGIGPASDIYALGVLLYELLTGRLPFDSESQLELFRQHIMEPAPSLAHACPGEPWLTPFEPVVKKALAKSPKDRFLSVEEMGEALSQALLQSQQIAAFLPTEGVAARETGKIERVSAQVTEYEQAREGAFEETQEEAQPIAWEQTLMTSSAQDTRMTLLLSEALPDQIHGVDDVQSGILSADCEEVGATLPMSMDAILATMSEETTSTQVGEEVCRVSATEEMPALSLQKTVIVSVEASASADAFPVRAARKHWWQVLYLAPVWLFFLIFREGRALLGKLLGERSSRYPSL